MAFNLEQFLRVAVKVVFELDAQLHVNHVSLSVPSGVRPCLAEHGFGPQMGARPMARVIQEKIKRPLADELLFGKLVGGGRVVVGVAEGQLSVRAEEEAQRLLTATVE